MGAFEQIMNQLSEIQEKKQIITNKGEDESRIF